MEILRPVSPVIRGEGNKLSRTDVAREPPAQFFHGSNATFIINFCTAWYIHASGSLNNSIRGSRDRTEFRKLPHRKAVLRILAVFALSASLPSLSAATDPFSGDWKRVQTKVKIPPRGPVTQFLHIEIDEVKVVIGHKGTSGAGEPVQWEIKTDFSGKLTGIVDVTGIEAVRCWHSDPRIILMKLFDHAVSIGFWTAEVSRNGKALKVTSTAFDATGKETNSIDWFDKL